jgi:voltage-gated potassium channel
MDIFWNKHHKVIETGLLILISLNVLAVILETEETLYSNFKLYFDGFEIFSLTIFIIEYILRLTFCVKDPIYKSPIKGRLKFVIQPLSLIDLMAILPSLFPIFGFDLRFLRAVRLFRLFRILKIGRYSQSLITLMRVLKAKKEELGITIFSGTILLILCSSLMYFLEHEIQPDKFSSIFSSMWWGVATLTTVGYGDVFPITVGGKILAAVISVLGIGLFVLPAGIVASGFSEEIQRTNHATKPMVCPHCGKELV